MRKPVFCAKTMKKPLIFIITIYQKVLSPDQGFIPLVLGRRKPVCIYYPTCSEYAKQAIDIYGAWKGTGMAIARIGRCNPFHEPGVDLVPPKADSAK